MPHPRTLLMLIRFPKWAPNNLKRQGFLFVNQTAPQQGPQTYQNNHQSRQHISYLFRARLKAASNPGVFPLGPRYPLLWASPWLCPTHKVPARSPVNEPWRDTIEPVLSVTLLAP